MRSKRIVLTAVFFQLMAWTALAQKVKVDYDHSTNFSQYKTYAWKVATRAKTPLMDNRIIQAVDNQMILKGLTKVDEGKADLVVTYHAAVDYETQLNTVGMGYGWGFYGGDTTTYVDKIPVG